MKPPGLPLAKTPAMVTRRTSGVSLVWSLLGTLADARDNSRKPPAFGVFLQPCSVQTLQPPAKSWWSVLPVG